jgi:hypothetical protein
MNCARCKHEFCWLCLGPFYGYNHEKLGLACPYRYVAVVGLMFALIIMSTVKIGYAWDWIGVHLFKFYYGVGFALNIDFQAIFVCIIGHSVFLEDLKYMYNDYKYFRNRGKDWREFLA